MTTVQGGVRGRLFDLAFLVLVCGALFARLGSTELESWDESLYAIRAEACLRFGAWLDQSAYAAGGLYSGAHPPLGVWAVACSTALFGRSEAAVRLPAALCGAGIVIIVSLFLRARLSRVAAAAATVCLAAGWHFNWYMRHAQLDAFQLFFTAAACVLFARVVERGRARDAVLAGAALGLALLSKLLVSGLLVAALLACLLVWRERRLMVPAAVMLGTALLLASPWYLYMAAAHGGYAGHVFDAVRTLAVEGYGPAAGKAWWYYLNQILVALPFLAAVAVARPAGKDARFLFSLGGIWFSLVLVVLLLGATGMQHFVLQLLLPGALLIASSLHGGFNRNRILLVPSVVLLGALCCWSLSAGLRHALKTGSLSAESYPVLLFAAAGMLLLAVAVGGSGLEPRRRFERSVVALSAMLFAWIWFRALFPVEPSSGGGAREVSAALEAGKTDHLVVVHPPGPYVRLQPQLAYYLDGWTLGWLPGRTHAEIPYTDTLALRTAMQHPAAVVWVTPWDTYHEATEPEQAAVATALAIITQSAKQIATTPSYTLYTR